MEYGSIPLPISISLLMTYVLAHAYPSNSILGLSLLCIIPLPFALFISLSISKTRKLIEDREMLEEFVEKIRIILGPKSKIAHANKRLEQVVPYCRDTRLGASFRSAIALSRLGYPIHISIAKSHGNMGKISEFMRSMPMGVDPKISLSNALAQYEDKMRRISSTLASRLQRYSTANMFISTIAPSFVIFGFIGDLVISQRAVGITALVVVLDMVIPFLYTLSNFTMYRGVLE